jgi:hypothetical protein
MAGRLHQQGDVCPACDGTGRLPEPAEERTGGYVNGPAPHARLWISRVGGWSGLGVVDLKAVHLFSERFKSTERDALRDMEDGLLAEHLARLRRILVMAREDNLPEWLVTITTQRHAIANDELRWRNRAGDLGADRVQAELAWRERCDRVRAGTDLGKLIAFECDKARLLPGNKWEACCPFHSDRSPSLSIDVEKALWFCHGCGVGGDAFTYVELRYGLDFASAVRHLEQRL